MTKVAPRIAFVAVPDHPQVDKEDVVVAQDRIAFGALLEGLQSIFAKTHQRRMPDPVHTQFCKHLQPQCASLGFEHAWLDACGYLRDGFPGLALGVEHALQAVGEAYGLLVDGGHWSDPGRVDLCLSLYIYLYNVCPVSRAILFALAGT